MLDAACEEACRILALPTEHTAAGWQRSDLPAAQLQAQLVEMRRHFPGLTTKQAERCAGIVDALAEAGMDFSSVAPTAEEFVAKEFGAGMKFVPARRTTWNELDAYRAEEMALLEQERTLAHVREARILAQAAADADLLYDESSAATAAAADADESAEWLESMCVQLFGSGGDGASAQHMHAAVLELLRSPRSADQLQNDLVELLGFDQ